LDLRKNGFVGELPRYFESFRDLRILSLGYNGLHGEIPLWITNLINLQVLDLSNNKFSGRIPSHLERLQGFQNRGSSKLSANTLYEDVRIVVKGAEQDFKYMLASNTIFDLSNNNLLGEIPTSIGNLSMMRLLNLSGKGKSLHLLVRYLFWRS
jgi:hypothetical protein